MIRSIAAVLVGLIFTGVLSLGTDWLLERSVPDTFDATGGVSSAGVLALTIAYVALYQVIGSWLAARIAESHRLRHAMIVGVLLLIWALYSALADWSSAPTWYHLVVLALVLPCAWLGGWLGARE